MSSEKTISRPKAGTKEAGLAALRERKNRATKAKPASAAPIDTTSAASGETPVGNAEGKTETETMRTSAQRKTAKTTTKTKHQRTWRPKASLKARGTPERKAKEAPTGMAAKIAELASRANGASRDELIKLSGWKAQAWKWYFVNSKDTGLCQRFGYTLKVLEGKEGESRYKITKR